MNSKQFALGGFKNYRDDELLVKGTTILKAMTSNIFFPTPRPSLAEIRLLVEDYQDKLALARRKGSPQDTANKITRFRFVRSTPMVSLTGANLLDIQYGERKV